MELTTVGDDFAVFHRGTDVMRIDGLAAATRYEFHGRVFSTLPRPAGPLRARIATVNDVHLGEVVCGKIGDSQLGPILQVEPGATPYPEVMNAGAVAEMSAANPDLVVAKGDLTNDGQPEEFAAFEHHYRTAFGDRLLAVRGNHDSYQGQSSYAGDRWVELPGVAVALLDTVLPFATGGTLRAEQLDWLADRAATSSTPVLVMGHHDQWVQGADSPRGSDPSGLDRDASDALDAVAAACPAIVAYTAGHSHRHLVRPMRCGVPSIQVGCVKDFPGTWAEYRVYEGGIQQIVHRISAPDALAWSERCRVLYSDFGVDYPTFALGTLDDRCFTIPLR